MAERNEGEKPSAAPARETSEEISLVPPYKVMLHNDDVTPMDFVVETLIRHFSLARATAGAVMREAHAAGVALVAIMPLEQAEFKVQRAHEFARANAYPLTFSIESAE